MCLKVQFKKFIIKVLLWLPSVFQHRPFPAFSDQKWTGNLRAIQLSGAA